MGFLSGFKARKAQVAQRNGNNEEARRLYEEAFAEGVNDARFVLPYALLLLRAGEYQKAREFLVKHQKAPGMGPEQRTTLIVDYAACCFRLGDIEKGIAKLEELHRKNPNGLIYQTLGYLYVEKYDRSRRPESAPAAEAPAPEENAAASGGAEQAVQNGAERPQKADVEELAAPPDGQEPLTDETDAAASPEDAREAGVRRALAFEQEAVAYDEEDPICLDNLGQFHYRVLGDREEARRWFDKAIAIKDSQIDTLWFLSRYDAEAGDTAAALEKLEKAAEGRFSPLNYCTRQAVAEEIARLKAEAKGETNQ